MYFQKTFPDFPRSDKSNLEIDLIPAAAPIAITPYRLALSKCKNFIAHDNGDGGKYGV
jgi:hypothetical protein